MNLKAVGDAGGGGGGWGVGGELGFHPHAGGPSFFLGWSFEHQFNSSSRTLSETLGKWVLLM